MFAAAFGVALLAPSSAYASGGATTPPAAVLAALRPGSSTFDQVVRLGATNEKGDVDQGRASTLREGASFGAPRQYAYYWEPTSSLSSEPEFTEADVYSELGRRWISIQYEHGVPFSMVALDDHGANVGVGGWTDDELVRIDALPADALVVTDGRFGEAFAVSPDRRTITALDPAAEALLGVRPVDVATFRSLKATEAAARAVETLGAGPDSSGGGAGISTTSPPDDGVAIVAGALAVVGLGAAATAAALRQSRRARRARDHLRTSPA